MMICSRRLYKGNAYDICLPLADSGVTLARFYTRGDVIVEKEPEISGDSMCFSFTEEDLASLEDGVLRYQVVTDYETTDTNSPYVVVTPGDYSGSTLEDLLEDAYESGYTDGQEGCTGGTCEGVYESGYTDGYQSGYTDGEATCEECDCTTAYTSGYTEGYQSGYTDGQESVDCTTAYTSGYTDGYESGNTDGYQTGYDDGYSAGSESCSGEYDRGYSDGYESGYTDGEESVDCTSAYTSGYTAGETAQKAKLAATAVTENGVYSREDGFSSVTVSIPAEPLNETLTENGTYAFAPIEGYYTGVQLRVNVPQTGYTKQDLDNAYASGYTDGYHSGYTRGTSEGYQSGYTEGYQSGYTDGQDTCEDCTDAYNSGYTSGHTDGYQEGYQSGYTDGQDTCEECDCTTAYTSGYTAGYSSGYTSGYTDGVATCDDCEGVYDSGYTDGYESGSTDGYQSGYTDGYDEAMDECTGHTPTPYSEQYFTVEALESGTFYVRGTPKYSINDGSWETATVTTPLYLTEGDKVRFKAYNNYPMEGVFSANTMQFIVYGNLESLEYGDDFTGATSVRVSSGFTDMFILSTGLMNIDNLVLPANTLKDSCYKNMFKGCTGIVSAPDLTATKLGAECYRGMFSGCTSLETAPALPATALLGKSCYEHMFSDCISLTAAPELPVETLFSSAYTGMFSGCTSLNYIKCLATDISASNCVYNWVDGVSQSGVFVKKAGVNWPTGVSGIPTGWTVVESQ